MKTIPLQAQARTIHGSKVKQLRAKQIIPANIFGRHVKSLPIEVSLDHFMRVFTEAGETGLVELSVGTDLRPVLIKEVQINPVTGSILHVDFYQVDLKEKVRANVPLKITGEASAVAQKLGVLLELIDEIAVEALPTELPEFIPVDVSSLSQVGDHLRVRDLQVPAGAVLLADSELEVVKIGELVSKEAEAQAQAEAAAALEAASVATEGQPAEAAPVVEVEPEAAASPKPEEK